MSGRAGPTRGKAWATSGRAGDIGLCSRPPDRDHKRMDPRPDEVIKDGQVTLRRYRIDDLDAIFEAVTSSVDHLRPWLPWAVNYSKQSAAEFLAKSVQDWEDGKAYNYAITTAGALAGGTGLRARVAPGGVEIGPCAPRPCTP